MRHAFTCTILCRHLGAAKKGSNEYASEVFHRNDKYSLGTSGFSAFVNRSVDRIVSQSLSDVVFEFDFVA